MEGNTKVFIIHSMPVIITKNTTQSMRKHINTINIREVINLLGKHCQAWNQRSLQFPISLQCSKQIQEGFQILFNSGGCIGNRRKGMRMV